MVVSARECGEQGDREPLLVGSEQLGAEARHGIEGEIPRFGEHPGQDSAHESVPALMQINYNDKLRMP